MPAETHPNHMDNKYAVAVRLQSHLAANNASALAAQLRVLERDGGSEGKAIAAYLRQLLTLAMREPRTISASTVALTARLIAGAANQPADEFEGLPS